jgi:hypothetical protein
MTPESFAAPQMPGYEGPALLAGSSELWFQLEFVSDISAEWLAGIAQQIHGFTGRAETFDDRAGGGQYWKLTFDQPDGQVLILVPYYARADSATHQFDPTRLPAVYWRGCSQEMAEQVMLHLQQAATRHF